MACYLVMVVSSQGRSLYTVPSANGAIDALNQFRARFPQAVAESWDTSFYRVDPQEPQKLLDFIERGLGLVNEVKSDL